MNVGGGGYGTRTEGRMIDVYRASNSSVRAVYKSTGCTLGICRSMPVVLCIVYIVQCNYRNCVKTIII